MNHTQIQKILDRLSGEPFLKHTVFLLVLAVLFTAVWRLVYLSGGTAFVHVHLIYVPIIVGAFMYNVSGGVAAGLLGGYLMGPVMPLNLEQGLDQSLINWTIRLVYLTAFGGLIGFLSWQMALRKQRYLDLVAFDPATGLHRTNSFMQTIVRYFGEEASDGNHALLQLQVKNADDLTLAFGLEAFEGTIREAAQQLRGHMPKESVLGRTGQDRLNIFIPDCHKRLATSHAANLLWRIEDSVGASDVPLVVDAEVGMAVFPDDANHSEGLLYAATAALVDGARNTRQINFFDNERHRQRQENFKLLADLKQGLARGELEFHAQPKGRCKDLSYCGAELLVRWRHPKMGMVPPARFIPLAERSRLMFAITEKALDGACGYIDSYLGRGGVEEGRISINLSGEDLLNPRLIPSLRARLIADPRIASLLGVEITETTLVQEWDWVTPVLKELRGMGIAVAVDDFGTGYSSLAYLKNVPADKVKLDRSFVSDILASDKSRAIIRHSIALAHDLGMETIAEGVEDEATFLWLKDAGCDMIQGYWYARPMPQHQALIWLTGKR